MDDAGSVPNMATIALPTEFGGAGQDLESCTQPTMASTSITSNAVASQ